MSVNESRKLVRLSSRGHKFLKVEFLNLHNVSFKNLQYVNPKMFPALRVLRLRYICPQTLPMHPNVSILYLVNCDFNATIIFPFPNLWLLVLEDCTSEISSSNPLPQLYYLERLILKWSVVSQTLSRRRFPRLKCLEMKGDDVVEKIKLPHLEVLSLDLPRNYNLQGQPNLRHLTVFKNGDHSFLQKINEERYPKLEKLEIDLGVQWQDLDLALLPPLGNMSYLSIASRGTVDVGNLNVERYPSLRTVYIDSDEVDVSQLPADHQISTLTVPYNINNNAIVQLLWPMAIVTEAAMAKIPETGSKMVIQF